MNNELAMSEIDKRAKPAKALSLRAKLILSYLLVILGTVLVLSIAISFAAQNYLRQQQIDYLNAAAGSWAEEYENIYIRDGGWPRSQSEIGHSNSPSLLVLVNQDDHQLLCLQPGGADTSMCSDQTVQDALTQAVQGQPIPPGTIEVPTRDGSFSSLYESIPLKISDQYNHQTIIGALFITQPQSNRNDLTPLLNQAIVIAGLVVTCIATLCAFLLVRRFTRPLKSLTVAAEQMKGGKYTQRVEIPKAIDELGELALTFNEMADTIEADVTELRRQDQVRRDLIANIAHDLATPLTAIQGLSEALADNVISEPLARQETAQRIGREVLRLRRLVADVRQMSSLEAGHDHLDLAPLDMHSLIDETVQVIAPECEQMGIAIHNDTSSTTPLVQADSDRITQVLLNLLDNARRHTPEGGQIQIGALPQGKNLAIWVKDTGIGIDPADLPHIFERFYRADRSRTTATGGSGLGLSIVKAILSAHGGAIWAESIPGRGTRITFTLPLVQPAQLAQHSSPAAPLLSQPRPKN